MGSKTRPDTCPRSRRPTPVGQEKTPQTVVDLGCNLTGQGADKWWKMLGHKRHRPIVAIVGKKSLFSSMIVMTATLFVGVGDLVPALFMSFYSVPQAGLGICRGWQFAKISWSELTAFGDPPEKTAVVTKNSVSFATYQ